jgi:hypothetical protein
MTTAAVGATKVATPTPTVGSPTVTSLTVTWTPSANATAYTIEWAKTAGALGVGTVGTDYWAHTVDGQSASSYVIPGLDIDTNYFVRIKADSTATGFQDSDWSSAVSGRTNAPEKLAAPSGLDEDGRTTTTITVEWEARANASGYIVQWALTTAGFAGELNKDYWQDIITDGDEDGHTISGLTASTTYQIRIIATGTGAYSNSDPSSAVAMTTATPADVPIGIPSGLAVGTPTSSTLTVTWSTVEHASAYTIQWAKSETALGVGTEGTNYWEHTVTGQASTSYTVHGLEPSTEYFFRIKADTMATGFQDSAWSAAVDGTTAVAGAPEKPGLPTASDPTATSVELSWPAVAGATGYEIQYKLITNAKNVLLNATQIAKQPWMTQYIPGDATSVTILGLNAGATYQFEVRAVNAHGKSDWSATSGNVAMGAVNSADVKFTAKTKAVTGKIVVEEKAKGQLKADSGKVSWVPVASVDSYVVTYLVPSGLKGVPGTTVQLVITKSMLEAGNYTVDSPFGECSLVVDSNGKLTLAINGLRASASYKLSIVAKDAGGFTTKAMNATVKTAAVAPVKKLVVDKAKTTANSVGFSIQTGGKVDDPSFVARGYIVQVYAPAIGTPKVPQLVQTLYTTGTGSIDIAGLQAKTKYTIVVTATDADMQDKAIMEDGHLVLLGQKLSASKSVAITTKK